MQHHAIKLDRFFFAILPDIVTARRTDVFAEGIAGGARRIGLDRQHITLAITDDYADYPHDLVARLLKAGRAVAAAPFDLRLERVVGSYRSVALRPATRIPGLAALQAKIEAAMLAEGGQLRPDWRFSPHQTLFYREGAPFNRLCPPFDWAVSAFVLVHSAVGRTRHTVLDRWALRGDGGDDGQAAFAF